MKKITVKITGVVPMLMHADTLADPLHPATIAMQPIKSKTKKKEADHLWLAENEWKHSLYFNNEGEISVPNANVKATLVNGAKLNKLGTTIKRAVLIPGEYATFESDCSGDIDEMWKSKKYVDIRTVKVGTAKIVRYRPKFTNWSVTVDVLFDEEQINLEELKNCFENAGNFVGLGDFRPTFGLFTCEFEEAK